MSLAGRLGLPAARTAIRSFEGSHAIVVARYDRRKTSTGIERLHQEDLCQSLGISPAQKYQEDGGPGIREIVDVFRRVQPKDRADATARRFLLAVAFNWLIGAPDAHAKNYSLLLQGSAAVLAPLYDIATITPYDQFEPDSARIAHAVDGCYRLVDIDQDSWHAQATEVGLDGTEFVEALRAFADRAPAEIDRLSTAPEVIAVNAQFAADLRDALQERVVVARAQLL